jgi:hypothetical protein
VTVNRNPYRVTGGVLGVRAEPQKRQRGWAPLVWVVEWVDTGERHVAMCGHRHATADEATMCPWEPNPLPPVGAGLVVQVRDPEYRTSGQIRAEARKPREQLCMPWGNAAPEIL